MINCAFGAMVAIPDGEGSVGSRGMIMTQGDPLLLRGVYLYGNVKISSGPNSNYKFNSLTDFELRGYHESLIFTNERTRPADRVNVRLGGNDTNNDKNFNLVFNNISLVSNARVLAPLDGDATNFAQRGPVLGCFINNPGELSVPTNVWGQQIKRVLVNSKGLLAALD